MLHWVYLRNRTTFVSYTELKLRPLPTLRRIGGALFGLPIPEAAASLALLRTGKRSILKTPGVPWINVRLDAARYTQLLADNQSTLAYMESEAAKLPSQFYEVLTGCHAGCGSRQPA